MNRADRYDPLALAVPGRLQGQTLRMKHIRKPVNCNSFAWCFQCEIFREHLPVSVNGGLNWFGQMSKPSQLCRGVPLIFSLMFVLELNTSSDTDSHSRRYGCSPQWWQCDRLAQRYWSQCPISTPCYWKCSAVSATILMHRRPKLLVVSPHAQTWNWYTSIVLNPLAVGSLRLQSRKRVTSDRPFRSVCPVR